MLPRWAISIFGIEGLTAIFEKEDHKGDGTSSLISTVAKNRKGCAFASLSM
jgi:hypothetical protein